MVERVIKKAVVTGPTGAVGTALCLELAERGVDVYAVCRPESKRANALPNHPRIFRIFCDLTRLSELPGLVPGGADAFYHLAWAHTIGSGRNDMAAQVDNVRYTIDAVRVAQELRCQVFIGAGSQAEYGKADCPLRPDTPCFPVNGYGMAKLCAGQMSRIEAERLGLDHVWVRILSVYGPGDGLSTMISSVICQLLRGEKPALTGGEQWWDYLYSGDAARALFLIGRLGVSGRVYPLGSGNAMPLRNYIEILRDEIDPALPLGFGEIPYGPLQVDFLEADLFTLWRDTGFEPEVCFEQGIRKTIEYWKGRYYV